MTLTVDAIKHEYWAEGIRLKSITECLKESGVIEKVYADDHALWVGTATHRAIELWVKGTLNWESLDESLKPRVAAYADFVAKTAFNVIESELPVHNSGMGLAGTLDLYGAFPDGVEGIVEIKSGAVAAWAGIQTAGQDILLGGGKHRRRFGLKVPAHGPAVIRPFTDPDDYNVFLAAATIAHWRAAH